MKKFLHWMLAAILICGTTVFTACTNDDNPAVDSSSTLALIVKNGDIEYFQQIESAFRNACKENNLVAAYFATTEENAWQEQVDAVNKLRSLSGTKLKGIIYAPCKGPNGESAEAEVAALAQERGIPVIILDSPVGATSPLASCPYFGTDNTAAGQAMAEKVTDDKVAVFAMANSPGVERAEAFKAMKPNAVIYQVGDKCNEEVKAVLDEYSTFVFCNGNSLVDVMPMLTEAGKQAYTFDIYGEFLDELIDYSPMLKGIMAQNTFEMARKAVDAVVTNAKQGEMVPTFFVTRSMLRDPIIQPFLKFYYKQVFDAFDGLFYLFSYPKKTAEVVEPYMGNYEGDIVVPDYVEKDGIQFAVTSIGEGAFKNTRITSLQFPKKTLKRIRTMAIYNLHGLKALDIPETVTTLNQGAIEDCPDLTRIHIPASVEVMEDHAIGGCPLLESITIDEGNTHYGIYDGVLIDKAQTRLIVYPAKLPGTTYTVPATVKTIDKLAFQEVTNLKSVTIPAAVSNLVYDMFEYSYSLEEINIDHANTNYCSEDGVVYNAKKDSLIVYPDGKPDKSYTVNAATKVIGKEAFANAYQLEKVTVPEGVTTISAAAFYQCYSLKEVSLPESVTTMEGMIFAYCEKLESVILPPHITKISMATFFGCKALRSITIPAEVTFIDLAAFYLCNSLKEVTCLGTTPPTADSAAFLMVITKMINLYVPDESVELYKADPVWMGFNVQPISAKQKQ